MRNEPEEPVPPRVAALRAAIMAEIAARRAEPGRDQAIMDGLVRDYWVARTGLPLAEAG